MPKRLAIVAVAAVALIGAVWLYGHSQYKRGAADERVKQQLAQARLDVGVIYERDKADAKYRSFVAESEVENDVLLSVRNKLYSESKDLRYSEKTNTIA